METISGEDSNFVAVNPRSRDQEVVTDPSSESEENSLTGNVLNSAPNNSLFTESSGSRAFSSRSGKEMSESQLLSSPSTNASKSPNSTNASKSPGSRGSLTSRDEPYLIVPRQPPKCVYSNESFEVELQLEVPKTLTPPRFLTEGQEFEVVASLAGATFQRDDGPDLQLVTQPSRISLVAGEDGVHRCKVLCMIRADGIPRDQGASVAVRFRARPESSPLMLGLVEVMTNSISIVNYKIRMILDDDWGSVWYKDEGGRDKSMEVFVAIYDKDGQLRTGEQIPLLPVLCYKSATGGAPAPVSNQEILRTLGTTRVLIDKDTGRARIRFRVEDVSKNHQAQDFVLMVGTDPKAKGFKDVAPDYSPAVNIRSKRNKRSRAVFTNNRTSSEVPKRLSPSAAHPYEQPHDTGSPIQAADVPRVREALRSIIHWSDEVVNGLFPLQWQVLGYAQHPDGTPDYHRPYHNMPNPNPCINRVLGMYSDTVRDSLRVLLTAVEQASPTRSDDPSSLMPIPIAVPRPPVDDGMYGSVMRGLAPPQVGHMIGHAGMPMHGMQRRMIMGHQGGPVDMYGGPSRHDLSSMYPGAGTMPPPPPHMMQPHHQGMHPSSHAYMRGPPESEMLPMHMGPRTELSPTLAAGVQPHSMRPEDESREDEVEYVLAKQYKALRTGERLGFPAYSENKEILGFYREQGGGGVRQFSPISRHRNDFGPLEILQATEILEDAIKKKSDAVHSLKDWGSIDNVLNQALVYDWRQDLGGAPQGPPS